MYVRMRNFLLFTRLDPVSLNIKFEKKTKMNSEAYRLIDRTLVVAVHQGILKAAWTSTRLSAWT